MKVGRQRPPDFSAAIARTRTSTFFARVKRPVYSTVGGLLGLFFRAPMLARDNCSAVNIDEKKLMTWAGSSGDFPYTVTGPRHQRDRKMKRCSRIVHSSPGKPSHWPA